MTPGGPSATGTIVANVRTLSAPLTGVQRYAEEILSRIGVISAQIAPRRFAQGMIGHLWEQFILPTHVGNALLWSPGNTGPLGVRRQVVTIHDVAALDHPEWVSARFAALYRWLTPRLCERVRGVIVVSEFTRDRLLAHTRIEPSRVHVVPNGVSEEFRPIDRGEAEGYLRLLGLSYGRYILTVGSIVPRKNLARLLSAWTHAAKKLPTDVVLVIAGEPGSHSIFPRARFIGDMARVRWTGRLPAATLPSLYSGALAFAFVPLYEGFGLPVIEAMACGTPVLTSNATALPEVAGGAALMTDPYDVEAIAESLVALASQEALRASLTQGGLQRAKHFSWDRSARTTSDVLRRAAAE